MRVTNAVARKARKKRLLKLSKGLRGRKGNCSNLAKQYVFKREINKYIGAKRRKRDFRSLWITRINAALRTMEMKYSTVVNILKKTNSFLNRKTLSELASRNIELFKKVILRAKSTFEQENL